MIDPILAGALISIQRYQAAEPKPESPSNVVYLADYRRLKWMRTYTRPMPPYRGDAA